MNELPLVLPPSMVPGSPGPIIGREHEIPAVCELLDQPDVRLVTLVGPGGVGKTRLALAVCSHYAAQNGLSVVVVSLAPLRDPNLVLPVVATTLGVDFAGAAKLPGDIAEHLGDTPVLVLLDNFEHLSTAAPVVAELLATCSTVKVIATSRKPVQISGEHIFDVPALALPDLPHLPSAAELAHIESVTLFIQRAKDNNPRFELTPDNAEAIAEICVRVDGLPLAIELAAVRLQELSPTCLLEQLTSRLDLLTHQSSGVPARHQTLRSTIDWSYNLLKPFERLAFQRMAVFVGGCDLAAAEYIIGVAPQSHQSASANLQPLDALYELLDNALLRREDVAGEPRFMMLETIREYALERLEASEEATEIRRWHAQYFAALAHEAEPALSIGQLEGHWPERLERDHANLRLALAWSLDQEDPGIGLHLAADLIWFWWIRGHLAEGIGWLEHALVGVGDDHRTLRSRLLDGAGKLARTQGNPHRAAAFHEESLCIATDLADDVAMSRALENLALVAEDKGEVEQAITLYEHALELARKSGQPGMLARILTNYGLMKLANADSETGVALLEEGLIIAQKFGPSGLLGAILSNLGDARLQQGDRVAAAVMYRECLRLQAELGNQRGIADALLGIASIAVDRGDLFFATGLLAAAQALYESIEAIPPPAGVQLFDDALHKVRTDLDSDTLSTLWESGRRADLETVIVKALGVKSLPSDGSVEPTLVDGPVDVTPSDQSEEVMSAISPSNHLTLRELDVLRLLAQGYSDRQIADALHISPQTAAVHVIRLRAKIGASSRTAAAAYAHRHGII